MTEPTERLPQVDAGAIERLMLEARKRGQPVSEDAARAALLLPQLSESELDLAAGILFPEDYRDAPPELLDRTIPLAVRIDAWLHRTSRL